MTGFEPLKKFLRNQRPKWFGHIEHISKKKPLAMTMTIIVKGKKKKYLKAIDGGC